MKAEISVPRNSNIKKRLTQLTTSPGVYQMLDKQNNIIYVGKAINLKKRVSSYFQKNPSTDKIAALVKQIDDIKVIVTQNESEAFLLENQLIKHYQPKYNILLRDDKSYPYIVLSKQEYPRLNFQRGMKQESVSYQKKFEYFGPYPSTNAVRETVKLVQKLFKLRTCRDSFFNHRSRPCLLYQIHQCSGPCVGLISEKEYQEDIRLAKLLLQGKNHEVMQTIVAKMQEASGRQDYESAAKYRDQISALRHVQTKQIAITKDKKRVDIFALVEQEGYVMVELIFIRDGCISGNQSFTPKIRLNRYCSPSEILSAFIAQYYIDHTTDRPKEVLLSHKCEDKANIESHFGFKIWVPQKGDKLKLIELANNTAREAIKHKVYGERFFLDESTNEKKFSALKQLINITALQNESRIACFDISHHGGESTVASCIVWGLNGFEKKYYRKFTISDITPGDDYAAMRQALEKYFQSDRCVEPDIILIDGGRGQLNIANQVKEKLGLEKLVILSMAKGEGRKSGLEKIYFSFSPQHIKQLEIDSRSSVFHLLQSIRDEAHRFAITTHRQKQSRKRKASLLENILGIGPKKRQALLNNLGGLQELKKASIEQLHQVPGIQRHLAEKIYRFFHKE